MHRPPVVFADVVRDIALLIGVAPRARPRRLVVPPEVRQLVARPELVARLGAERRIHGAALVDPAVALEARYLGRGERRLRDVRHGHRRRPWLSVLTMWPCSIDVVAAECGQSARAATWTGYTASLAPLWNASRIKN